MSYSGSQSYDASFSQKGVLTYNVSQLQVDGSVVRGVIDKLVPATAYLVTVQAVNGAMKDGGVGMQSEPATVFTYSGRLKGTIYLKFSFTSWYLTYRSQIPVTTCQCTRL